MDELCIRVESVVEAPQQILLQTSRAWWEGAREILQEPAALAREPFRVDLEAYRIGQRLLFRGGLAGIVELPCSRCAERYPHPFTESLDLEVSDVMTLRERPEGQLAGI